MKKMILSLSLIFLTIGVFSQETKKGLIGISIGPSFPLSDYANNDGENEDAGFAMTGLHLNFNFSYKFNDYLGIAALWTGNAHPVDVDKMVDVFWSVDPYLNWEVKSEAWSSGALMGGLFASIPYDNGYFDLKALIGYSSSTIPIIDVTASDGSSSINLRQNEASALAFAINLGAGLRYNVSDKIAMTINMDYFMTKPEFEVATTSDFGYSSVDAIGQTMKMINISFGIGYRLK
jgi:opacity protein-like surface antigen